MTLAGHQKKIFNSVQMMRAQMNQIQSVEVWPSAVEAGVGRSTLSCHSPLLLSDWLSPPPALASERSPSCGAVPVWEGPHKARPKRGTPTHHCPPANHQHAAGGMELATVGQRRLSISLQNLFTVVYCVDNNGDDYNNSNVVWKIRRGGDKSFVLTMIITIGLVDPWLEESVLIDWNVTL